MKHALWFLLFFTIAGNTLSFAQLPDPNIAKDTTKIKKPDDPSLAFDPTTYKPKVIPPSPDAASLGRYGEIPVELSKGTPSISIPLYDITSGSLKLPISLSYHASGVRVTDMSTSSGLSWTLNAGGAITRAVNGLPDENSTAFRSLNPPSPANTNDLLCYIGKIAAFNGIYYDGMSDGYFYNFNGNSGKFLYANKQLSVDQNLPAIVPVTIPYKPLKIQETHPQTGSSIYTIADLDGTIYTFGKVVNGKASSETTYSSHGPTGFISTWYLSQIVSANRMDTITLEYTAATLVDSPPLYSTALEKLESENGQVHYSHVKSISESSVMTVYPSDIYFRNGKVSFTYAADRLDLPNAKRLTGIYIYRKDAAGNYSELKHYELAHSYFSCTDGYSQTDINPVSSHSASSGLLKRLKLDSITEKNSAGAALPAHQFTYHEDEALRIYGSYAQDYWGFHNGAANQKLLIWDTDPTYTAEPSAAYGANRIPNFSYAIAGTIKSVQYPTGGKTVYTFESNELTDGTQGGGIRIKSIANFEGMTQLSKKEYSYPVGYIASSIFTGNMEALAYQFTSRVENDCAGSMSNYSYFPENYNYMLGTNSGSSIAYDTVEEIATDASGNGLGKTVSKFRQERDETLSRFPFNPISNDWKRGQLIEQNHYNAANNLVKQTKNFYRVVLTDSLVRGYGARATFQPSTCALFASYCNDNDFVSNTRYQWIFDPLEHLVGAMYMDSTITLTYDAAGANGVKEKTEITYATATHQQPTRQIITDSKNQNRETTYKYPHELASSSADYLEMVNRHVYNPVIEEENKVGGAFQSLVKTDYKKWYPSTTYQDVQGFFAPVSVSLQQAGGSLLPQIVFGEKLSSPTENGYDDKAHPVVYTERNGTVSRLTWWAEKGKQDLLNTQTINGLFTTTYDHNPLVGTKSMSDPDGKVTFYEYDTFNRLKNIRNDNSTGAIRKSFCYNYAGQVTDCSLLSSTTGKVFPSSLALIPVTTTGGPLPVTLISFTARAEGNTAVLSWNTASETNSERFDVERSFDGKSWATIGRVAAQLDSKTTQSYSFVDDKPLHGENLYRLKMVDRDGSFSNSKIEHLRFDPASAVYPNPVTMEDKLHLNSKSVVTHVRMTDMNGKIVYSRKNPGSEIDISGLATGVYLVQITTIDGAISIQKVLKR